MTEGNRAPAEKFTGKAEIYEKYRPGYPAACLDYLVAACGVGPGCAVADIGSGTGKFTGELLARGLAVWAVEPNGEMRAQAERRFARAPAFHSVAKPAEATGLPEGEFSLVTAAQSFHWFDRAAFRAECARILKPGGRVALVWNSRDESSPLARETGELFRRYCPEFRGFSSGIGEEPDVFRRFFRGGVYESRVFPGDLMLSLEEFVGRSLSASYAPRETDAAYGAFVEALAGLFRKYGAEGKVRFSCRTRSYLGRV